jgi:hypothetical protein
MKGEIPTQISGCYSTYKLLRHIFSYSQTLTTLCVRKSTAAQYTIAGNRIPNKEIRLIAKSGFDEIDTSRPVPKREHSCFPEDPA